MYLDSRYYPTLIICDNLDFTLWTLNVKYCQTSFCQKSRNIDYDVSTVYTGMAWNKQ